MTKFYPVSQPAIGEREIEYVSNAVRSGWVSSIGEYIERFEKLFAAFCGTRHALAVSNGTTGLHLALVSLGIKAGDEVIIPDLSFIATANAVAYTGASVVVADIDRRTLCIDPHSVAAAVTSRTKAIMPVHLYGHPAEMNDLRSIARKSNLVIIEDAAEAHGAEYQGERVGGFGECGVFSFYGNKVITTGEGGMITTNNTALYNKAKLLRDHAMSPDKRYWHTEIGFNYRMTNLQAALGVAQMERIDDFLTKRRQIWEWYRAGLADMQGLLLNGEKPGTTNVFWMICLEVSGMTEATRQKFMALLREGGVDSRPYFYPISDMPMYSDASTPIAHAISECGINLPSYTDLTETDVSVICKLVRGAVANLRLPS